MTAADCPAPNVTDPLVQGLLGQVDCHVQSLVRGGYGALFAPSGAFSETLSALLVIYVAVAGYRLLLGRSGVNVSDFAMTAVKLAAVLALATQWSLYEALVYRTLFVGPQEIAEALLKGFGARSGVAEGDVFRGLDRALTSMTAFSPAAPPGGAAAGAASVTAAAPTAAGQASTLLSRAGFDAALLLGSAAALLIATIGALLAAKIVLALLLALGPVFVALLLFDPTRGLFEGWMRAVLAFAFVPLSVTLVLALSLSLLDPQIRALDVMKGGGPYTPGVAFAVAVLVAVTVMVSLGLMGAGAVVFAGFKWPWRASPAAVPSSAPVLATRAEPEQSRPDRLRERLIAAARRARAADAAPEAAADLAGALRRVSVVADRSAGAVGIAADQRIGQTRRRAANPRRSAVRGASQGGGGR